MRVLASSMFAFWLSVFACLTSQLKADSGKTLSSPIFISLGSHCEPSQQLILNNLRSAAFPFDWLLTLDFQGFLSLIQDDFKFFMDRHHLIQDADGVVLNTYYHIDFRHELHDWPDNNFFKHYLEVKDKYKRRINRLKECKYNKTRAYFIRAAFDLNLNPHLPTITQGCTKINQRQAVELKQLLRLKFPKLDFYLVIINYVEENTESISGEEGILEFKIRKSHKNEDYSNLFRCLLKHAQKF